MSFCEAFSSASTFAIYGITYIVTLFFLIIVIAAITILVRICPCYLWLTGRRIQVVLSGETDTTNPYYLYAGTQKKEYKEGCTSRHIWLPREYSGEVSLYTKNNDGCYEQVATETIEIESQSLIEFTVETSKIDKKPED